jgi:hypothetical protein
LCLASVDVALDGTPIPVDLSEPINAIPERRTLLPTYALQELLLELAGDSGGLGLLSAGPRVGPLTFEPDAADPAHAGTLFLPIVLARKGTPPADVPIVDATFESADFALSRLDSSGWTDVTPSANVTLDTAVSPPRIQIVCAQDLAAAQPFVLAFQPSASQPTVDADGSPLRSFTRRFRFALDGSGVLALEPSV